MGPTRAASPNVSLEADRVGTPHCLLGTEVRLDPAGFDIGIRPSWEQALADVEARGGKPYAIPADEGPYAHLDGQPALSGHAGAF